MYVGTLELLVVLWWHWKIWWHWKMRKISKRSIFRNIGEKEVVHNICKHTNRNKKYDQRTRSPSVSDSTRKELHQQQEATMDRETKVLLKRIEDIKAKACKQFLQMLSVYAGKLDRLRALCAFHLWRLRMLGPEKYSEKATATTSGNIDVLTLAKRLAYDAGVQSEVFSVFYLSWMVSLGAVMRSEPIASRS
eukprot:g42939.t1